MLRLARVCELLARLLLSLPGAAAAGVGEVHEASCHPALVVVSLVGCTKGSVPSRGLNELRGRRHVLVFLPLHAGNRGANPRCRRSTSVLWSVLAAAAAQCLLLLLHGGGHCHGFLGLRFILVVGCPSLHRRTSASRAPVGNEPSAKLGKGSNAPMAVRRCGGCTLLVSANSCRCCCCYC